MVRWMLVVLAIVLAAWAVFWPRSVSAPARRYHVVQMQEQRQVARVRPPAVLALHAALHAFPAWTALLDAGDIYAKGSFPAFRPNPALAEKLYMCAAMCPDPAVAGMGQAKSMDVHAIAPEDIRGDELPEGPGTALLDAAMQRIMTPAAADPVHAAAAAGPVHAAADAVRSDAQNVHDHGVSATLRRSLAAMEPAGLDRDVVEAAIVELPGVDDAEKLCALQVLGGLKADAPHSSLGVTETDALGRVWARIGAIPDDELRANAVETLTKQLASGMEHGSAVCSTGMIARIVGTLDGIDEALTPAKPLWAVRQELGTLAAKVREDALAAQPPERVAQYERGDAPDLEGAMRREFARHATDTYCTTLGMRQAVLDPLLEMYAHGF